MVIGNCRDYDTCSGLTRLGFGCGHLPEIKLVPTLCLFTTTTMTTVSPFARSSAFEEPRLSSREQTVSIKICGHVSYVVLTG